MKQMYYFLFAIIALTTLFIGCNKDDEEKSEQYKLLTSHTWVSDSLIADGQSAGGVGELLYNFAGETKFNDDGTGKIGKYEGTWSLSSDNTKLTIDSDDLAFALTVTLSELTETSLKVTTTFPSTENPGTLIKVRMTFVPKS